MTARLRVPTKIVLRHFTAAPAQAPCSPTVVPLGKYQRNGSATMGCWRRIGSLYVERRDSLLFVARQPQGPWVRIPDWVLIAFQWIPQDFSDLQTAEPPMWAEPGRQRKRRATQGETEMLAIVALRQLGKRWPEIGVILGISRRTLAARRLEISRVVRDLDRLGNTETVDLDNCQALNTAWKGHLIDGMTHGKQTPARRLDWDEERTSEHHFARGFNHSREKKYDLEHKQPTAAEREKAERKAETEVVEAAVRVMREAEVLEVTK